MELNSKIFTNIRIGYAGREHVVVTVESRTYMHAAMKNSI
jgi:hypothetical protein